jgi:surfactin synthase thioesterase subunit
MTTARLLCLPHAGAGPSTFHSWLAAAPPGLEVLPVPMAGRDRRLFDKPHSDLHQAVRAIGGEVSPVLAGDTPVVLFGHCLGALLAYELARYLLRDGVPVGQLMVSGVAGPRYVRSRQITGLPDAEFLERVVEVAGYRNEAFDDPEMRELLLPALRADVQMHEDYSPRDCDPLEVPVMALRGEADETVSAEDIGQWREVTKAGFTVAELPGDHMYFLDQGPALLDLAMAASRRHPVTHSGQTLQGDRIV